MTKVGIIGSSEGDKKCERKAKIIGEEIAKRDHKLLTGGCTGIPHAAVEGAKKWEGLTIGISPATSKEEHLDRYNYPEEEYDLMIYTGFGLKGRNVILVRSCDAVIAISGGFGTLNELTIAHAEEKVIGLLTGVPGVSNEFESLSEKFGRSGRKIIASENPKELVKKVLKNLRKN